jgi:hypothetical protein
MFEKMIRKMELGFFIGNHHPRRAAADLHSEICTAIPGVNLTHAGEI